MSPGAQVGFGGGHVLAHSRSSSNLGDDGERDVDWEDEDGMNASMGGGLMTSIGMGLAGSQGGEEWDAQSSRFNLWAGGLNVPGFPLNAFGAPPGGEEWKRWAETEIFKERKRVEKLVGIVKALVDGAGKGGTSGPASSGGVAVSLNIDRELDGSKFSSCLCLFSCMLTSMASPAEHPARASRALIVL